MRGRGPAAKRPPQGDPVVDRALALLGAFDARHRSLTLGELSRRSGIPTSSTLRLAGRLMAWGALERDADGRFSIGLRLWEVASLAPRGQGLKQVAMPFMGDLEEVTRQHVLLAVRDGDRGACSSSGCPRTRRCRCCTGWAGDCRCTPPASGWCCSPSPRPSFQEEVLSRPLVHEPEKVAVSSAALRRTLAADPSRAARTCIRRRTPQPLVSVACPIFGADDRVAAALSVVVPQENAEPRLLGARRPHRRPGSISRGLGARGRSGWSRPR